MRINRGRKGTRAAYRLSADRDGIQLTVDETFWDETFLEGGTSALDHNISTVVAEIRAALYYIATSGTRH